MTIREILAVAHRAFDVPDLLEELGAVPGVQAIRQGKALKRHIWITVAADQAATLGFVIALDSRVQVAEDGETEIKLTSIENVTTTLGWGSRDMPLDVAQWFHNYEGHRGDKVRYHPPGEYGRDVQYAKDSRRAGDNIVVAVIDSGVDQTRTDEFDARVTQIHDGLGDGVHFHGTACASIIAGNACGFLPAAQILDVKTFSNSGTSNTSLTVAGMDDLLVWMQANLAADEILLVNCSFVADSFSTNTYAAGMDDLWAEGAIFFASGGNFAHNANDLPNYFPGSALTYSNIGACDLRGKIAQFSHFNGNISIYALGWNAPAAQVGSGYYFLGGTSFACPNALGAFGTWVQGETPPTDKATGDELVRRWRDEWCLDGNFSDDNSLTDETTLSGLKLARSYPLRQ